MAVRPSFDRVIAYKSCRDELGSCYCSRSALGYCYRPAAADQPPQSSLGSWALAVAAVGVAVWPLGPVAWLLARSARGRVPAAARWEQKAARWAYVIGLAETVWCLWVAYVILIDHL